MLPYIILTLVIAAAIAFFLLKQSSSDKSKKASTHAAAPQPTPKQKVAKVDVTAKSSVSSSSRRSSDADPSASPVLADHSLVKRHLRGHQGDITGLAVSPNCRHIASIAKDEQLRLWTIVESEKNTHFARHNLKKGEYGSAVAISHDDTYVIMAVEQTKQIQIFGIKDENDQAFLKPLHNFPTPHKVSITTVAMASNLQFIVTMAEGASDLNMHIFTVKGALIQTLPVAQLLNYSFALSDDAKYLAAATKLSDTKIWHVDYKPASKGSAPGSAPQVDKVSLAMTLKGHKRGVKRLAFSSPASGLLVAASMDGSFTCHDIRVRWDAREDPKLLYRVQTNFSALDLIDITSQQEQNEEAVIALTAGSTLQFWRAPPAASSSSSSSLQPTLIAEIPQAHKGVVTHMAFNKKGRQQLVTAGEGKTITIWNLPQM